ncbi:hypothetical protein HHI36_017075, partial [Cryptolaemus montrouzieri]
TEVQQVHNADTTAVTQVPSVEDFYVQASDTGFANSQSENTSTHELHRTDIVELPVIPPKVIKRNIRKRKSTILTRTPIKSNGKKRKPEKEQRQKKARKTKKN